jgi:hypothetical protein
MGIRLVATRAAALPCAEFRVLSIAESFLQLNRPDAVRTRIGRPVIAVGRPVIKGKQFKSLTIVNATAQYAVRYFSDMGVAMPIVSATNQLTKQSKIQIGTFSVK